MPEGNPGRASPGEKRGEFLLGGDGTTGLILQEKRVALLSLLNISCFVLHSLLMVFNLLGWIWPRTRPAHLVTLAATLFSWLVMGIWYGWGYCLCADWHFQIRRRMGIHGKETSYTELLLNQIPGITTTRRFADLLTAGGLVLILLVTGVVWYRHFRNRGVILEKTSKNQHSEEPSDSPTCLSEGRQKPGHGA